MEASKLIKHLKHCANTEFSCRSCDRRESKEVSFVGGTMGCMCDLMQKAANAIEELRSQLESHRDSQNAIRLEEKQATSDGWIPVTERLPEKDVRVLVWVGENSCNFPVIDTDRIHCGRWVRWDERITHWMPLPEPPKEDTP